MFGYIKRRAIESKQLQVELMKEIEKPFYLIMMCQSISHYNQNHFIG